MHLIKRQHIALVDQCHAQLELGAGEMDDVVLFEQAVAIYPIAIDERAVGAVLVDETQLAADVALQYGVKTTQSQRRDHHVVFLAAADSARQLRDHDLDVSAIRAERLQRPLLFQSVTPTNSLYNRKVIFKTL